MLYFENLNNSQKLTIVDFILNFYKNYFSKKEYYWVLLAQISFNNYLFQTSFII